LLVCFLSKVAFEGVEPARPEPLIAGEPTLRLLHRGGVEPARYGAAALVAGDQPGGFEHVEVLEHRGQRHGKGLCQRGDGEFRRLAEAAEHSAPGRIGQGGENAIEAVGLIVNHRVKL
jgi:hypothetical protein